MIYDYLKTKFDYNKYMYYVKNIFQVDLGKTQLKTFKPMS